MAPAILNKSSTFILIRPGRSHSFLSQCWGGEDCWFAKSPQAYPWLGEISVFFRIHGWWLWFICEQPVHICYKDEMKTWKMKHWVLSLRCCWQKYMRRPIPLVPIPSLSLCISCLCSRSHRSTGVIFFKNFTCIFKSLKCFEIIIGTQEAAKKLVRIVLRTLPPTFFQLCYFM